MELLDIVIRNACVVTMDDRRRIIPNGSIAISGDRIHAVGTTRMMDPKFRGRRVIDAGGKYVFPGLVNTHSHLFQGLLKGLGRDRLLLDWLDSSVRPALNGIGYEDLYTAAMVGCMENIRSGCTTVLDYQYAHGSAYGLDDAVIQAFHDTGIRGILGRGHTDVSKFRDDLRCSRIETEQDFFDDVTRLVSNVKGHNRISIAIAPGSIRDLSEEGFRTCRMLADQYSIPVTMHVLESAHDNEFCRQTYGDDLPEFLERTGLLGPDFLAVHCIQMDDRAFHLFKEYGVMVSHNPVSNMILGSGVAPVARMRQEGLSVALGTDGSASNDSQDMMETLKITALLHKCHHQDPSVMRADEVLEMATIGGAAAVGRADDTGTLETGKRADLWIMNPMSAHCAPVTDPVAAVVYHASQQNVETVIVDGQMVMENGRFPGIDEERLLWRIQHRADGLRNRVGLNPGISPLMKEEDGRPKITGGMEGKPWEKLAGTLPLTQQGGK